MINEGLDIKNLKEHDALAMKNPTNEDFSWKYNGELYTILAGEIKAFSQYVAFHLAKHLSTKIITHAVEKTMTKKQAADRNDPINGKISQLVLYDTPERRIALFKMFENEDIVSRIIHQYPFKGFVGDMQDYKNFIENYNLKESKPEKV